MYPSPEKITIGILHILPGKQNEIRLRTRFQAHESARLLQTNENVKFKKKGNILFFDSPERPNGLDDVIVVNWKEASRSLNEKFSFYE